MVCVIGGGITGLAAAYELTARGVPCRLFEASERLGGLIRTEHVDGFTIDAGADSMLAQKTAAVDLCGELGLSDALLTTERPRGAFVLRGGRLFPLPAPSVLGIPATWRQLAAYTLLPWPARLRLALEPLVPRARVVTEESVAAFFRRRFGAHTVDLLAQPLLGGIHAGDVERLSLPALFPRLAAAEQDGGSVLRWVHRTAGRADTDGAFRSLAGGMGTLVDALTRRLPPGAVALRAPVTALARGDHGWIVRSADSSVACDAVILACPASAASALLAPIDDHVARLCGLVRYASTVSVALAWPRAAIAHPLAGSGFVVPRAVNRERITACTWVSSKWTGRAPEGYALLRAYLGGALDPEAIDAQDDELIDVARRELSAILSITGAPLFARVYRWRAAGAQHEVGHRARLREVEARLARHRGLFVAGSGFRSIGVPDCIADGRAVAIQAGTLTHAA